MMLHYTLYSSLYSLLGCNGTSNIKPIKPTSNIKPKGPLGLGAGGSKLFFFHSRLPMAPPVPEHCMLYF